MIRWLQRRFALSKKGAYDTVKGSLLTALQNITLMLPVVLLFSAVSDMLSGIRLSEKWVFYASGSLCSCIAILIASKLQYDGTFLRTYEESGSRRIALAEKLRKIPLSFFSKKDIADLTSAIMNDSAVLETSQSHYVCPLAGAMISTAVIAIFLFVFSWRMAIAAIWPLPVSISIALLSSGVQKRLSGKSMSARIEAEDGIQEFIECIADLRSGNACRSYLKGLERKIRHSEKRTVLSELGTASFITASSLILKLGIASTALAGSYLYASGRLSMLDYAAFLIIASRLYDPLEGALQNLAAIIATDANIKRMNEILDYPIQTGSDKLTNTSADITFNHVSFSYSNGIEVLKDISFVAKQGQVTALVGPSGSGKTTVSRLASRFWDVDSGRISVGGMDISSSDPESLMSLYSIVFQDVTLFNNTVLENIRIGRRDATDDEVIAAAKLANVDEFAEKLPDRWNTVIGENGENLSGGERQRISIARAFLKDAPIILLDEATASLDVGNESAIQSAVSRLIRDKTVLIIAHRMRTVSNADQIIVLKDGVIAESGSPEKLLSGRGIFYHMAESQKKSQEWRI